MCPARLYSHGSSVRLPIEFCGAHVQTLGPASIAITWGCSDASCEVLLISLGFFLGWHPCTDFGYASL